VRGKKIAKKKNGLVHKRRVKSAEQSKRRGTSTPFLKRGRFTRRVNPQGHGSNWYGKETRGGDRGVLKEFVEETSLEAETANLHVDRNKVRFQKKEERGWGGEQQRLEGRTGVAGNGAGLRSL